MKGLVTIHILILMLGFATGGNQTLLEHLRLLGFQLEKLKLVLPLLTT